MIKNYYFRLLLALLMCNVAFCDYDASLFNKMILKDCQSREITVNDLLKSNCVITGLYTQCTNAAKCPAVAKWTEGVDALLQKSGSTIKIIIFNFDVEENSTVMRKYYNSHVWSTRVIFVNASSDTQNYYSLLKNIGFRLSITNDGSVSLHGKQAFYKKNNVVSTIFDRVISSPDDTLKILESLNGTTTK